MKKPINAPDIAVAMPGRRFHVIDRLHALKDIIDPGHRMLAVNRDNALTRRALFDNALKVLTEILIWR